VPLSRPYLQCRADLRKHIAVCNPARIPFINGRAQIRQLGFKDPFTPLQFGRRSSDQFTGSLKSSAFLTSNIGQSSFPLSLSVSFEIIRASPRGASMLRQIATAALALSASGLLAQTPLHSPLPRPKFDAFEVATIKPVENDAKSGRYLIMQGNNRFIGKNYTVKLLIAAAYSLSPKTISGGPSWIESDHYDIVAVTPGDLRPNHDEQMSMLRALLADRFKLTFHREQKDFSIYELQLAKGGPKLKPSTAAPDEQPQLISTVYPQRIVLPARNVSMTDLAILMQRAMLDRPVVDKTNLTGRFDFDLEWAPDETQFGGEVPVASADAPTPPLFVALQQQLGLKLEATRGPIQALVVDTVERPSAN